MSSSTRSNLSRDTLAILAMLALALAALGTAWISQYGFDLYPCELCLYQRLPYLGIAALCLLSLLPVVDIESRRLAILICAFLFSTSAAIAGYHVGVELGFWESSCAPTGMQRFSINEVRSALQKPGAPACNEPPFTFFGISMAGYNMMGGLIMAALAVWFARTPTIWKR